MTAPAERQVAVPVGRLKSPLHKRFSSSVVMAVPYVAKKQPGEPPLLSGWSQMRPWWSPPSGSTERLDDWSELDEVSPKSAIPAAHLLPQALQVSLGRLLTLATVMCSDQAS